MASIKTMESLWQYLQSLDLSRRNQKWLADKLIEQVEAGEEEECISKEEVLAGIDAGLKDMVAGRCRPARDLLRELEHEV